MKLYAFELGRKKKLCYGELLDILGESNLIEKNLDTAIFKIKDVDFQALQDTLGGTIKIMEIIERIAYKPGGIIPEIENILAPIETYIKENFKGRSGKTPFSVSTLSFKRPKEINIKKILIFSKKVLKSLGLNARFVNKDFKNTRPSTIYKAKVIRKGIDICVIRGSQNIYIGKTIAIQNIDAYTKRDFHKPKRDAKVGMLPPKLAQIMINLAGNTSSIYDPFCGTGTILMESMLMGVKAFGSDISPRMVDYTNENCQWLNQAFDKNVPFEAFIKDAKEIEAEDLPKTLDAIVTEGYLGNPQNNLPNKENRDKAFEELGNLHLKWLTAAHKATGPKCKIVMCVAGFMNKGIIEHLPNFEDIAEKAGYRIVGTYTYDRQDQIVIRDIKVLEKR